MSKTKMPKHIEKVARLCWNTNGWRRPSGKGGKSKSNDSYEKEMGFGHEEWLLDDSKVMPDGYHYGFLEQLRLKTDMHIDKVYDIHLFTMSQSSSQKIYIGCLRNAICVSQEESIKTYNYYRKKGWINEMQQDVSFVDGKVEDFDPSIMFNIKFKFEDANIYYSNQPILKPESVGHRYKLMNKKDKFGFEKGRNGKIKVLDTNIFERNIEGGKIKIDPLHKKIQNAVVGLLQNDYSNIQLEKGTDDGTRQRVDIKGFSKIENEWHFFEVKTMSAKRSIREALGQLLEYAHYPNVDFAQKLFIIGPEPPDEEDKSYMQLLREKYHLPVWFRWYSFVKNKLHEGV